VQSISFRVDGIPMQKGSVVKMKGVYRPAGTTHTRHLMEEWESNVRYEAKRAMGHQAPCAGAVRFMCEFRMPFPASTIRKGQIGWYPHIKRPDVDKLLRGVLDPLTGTVWVDDSQVCFATCNKTYAWDNRPGAHIIVDFIEDEALRNIANSQKAVVNVLDSL
jgi:Holliday junction resolvase RusA-like endonuclease